MSKKRLKLFVWTNVLTDYSSGVVFALAETAEEAIQMLKEGELGDHHALFDGIKIDGQSPKVYDNEKMAYHLWGEG
uniref:Uncharacterized protein n=2 Tax=viral metagenome TaxID=1070528 RepID=A0A6M3KTW6_9ZZZZ